jgi:hypothetical protein
MSFSRYNYTKIDHNLKSISDSEKIIYKENIKNLEEIITNIISKHLSRIFLATNKKKIDSIIVNFKNNGKT